MHWQNNGQKIIKSYSLSTLLLCGSAKGTKLDDESSEHGGSEDVHLDQGLDMSVERKLKEEEVSVEEDRSGTSHGSPHVSDNEGSNCESVAHSPDDEASGEQRLDVRSVVSKVKVIIFQKI